MSNNKFTVYDAKGNPVDAKYLTDIYGNYVLSPRTGNPLIVPYDYDPTAEIQFGQSLQTNAINRTDAGHALETGYVLNGYVLSVDPDADAIRDILTSRDSLKELAAAFKAGAPHDLQRSYNGQVNGPFVQDFLEAASFNFGLVGAAAGYDSQTLIEGGGIYNAAKYLKGEQVTLGPPSDFFLNPEDVEPIRAGSAAFGTTLYGAPVELPSDEPQVLSLDAADYFPASPVDTYTSYTRHQ
ncbi:hypothetical protein [Rhizobium etli]|uniref:hypothetical protein n=1 Tax=Rhizobium etli TaxID=29449 RepID=UPI0003839A75|nr:hypothetical protein [Rhizobium etli]AGS25816.1 hypothetical protein REMIM1_PF00146 [Rhizobium etli bv. mimosae str. Mim1]